jgi:hypothetical protein
MMEAVSTSEMSVTLYKTAGHNIPKRSHLHKLSVSENRVLKKIVGPRRDEVTGG